MMKEVEHFAGEKDAFLSDGVVITRDAGELLRTCLRRLDFTSIGLLADENTATHCYPLISDQIPDHHLITIPPGEEHKNLQTLSGLWQQMMDLNFDRKSILINLGGGVITDIGGFAAATFKRGIRFIQIPTTLLGQVDAALGGKCGIDFAGSKNQIGVIQQPELVISDPGFLKTLPRRHLVAGMAEVLKYGFIAEPEIFEVMGADIAATDRLWPLIKKSMEIKLSIVESDPFEKGIRAVLNFGHTFGHAFESASMRSESQLLHGEAIAMGMVCDLIWSAGHLGTDPAILEQRSPLLRQFPLRHVPEAEALQALEFAFSDKKNRGREIITIGLRSEGDPVTGCVVSPDEFLHTIRKYNTWLGNG